CAGDGLVHLLREQLVRERRLGDGECGRRGERRPADGRDRPAAGRRLQLQGDDRRQRRLSRRDRRLRAVDGEQGGFVCGDGDSQCGDGCGCFFGRVGWVGVRLGGGVVGEWVVQAVGVGVVHVLCVVGLFDGGGGCGVGAGDGGDRGGEPVGDGGAVGGGEL